LRRPGDDGAVGSVFHFILTDRDFDMDLQLTGRAALVTGASKGIGRAIALTLAEEGMDVALVARDAALLAGVKKEVEARGRKAIVHAADLNDAAAAQAAVDAAVAAFGKLDLLVNNAGATKRGDFLKLTDQDWSDSFSLKFFGYVRLARIAWPHLMKTRGGIVNIGGVAGRYGDADFGPVGAVNASINLLTKVLADRGIKDGVRVNAINPGTIETDRTVGRVDRWMKDFGMTREQAIADILRDQKVARFGKPEEVAALVAMFASGRIDYLQGGLIDMDGGQIRGL
jgi:NAD(P)-dependent dehydrogenase (short-subunit alcohol dehydrogenase family)